MDDCKFKRMSPEQYRSWLKDRRKFDASLPNFFGWGEQRTMRVLKGQGSDKSVAKWESFKARHGSQFCENPTYRRGVALRNWGINVSLRGLKK